MDDPVFPKLPESIVECCKDPISEIWAKSDENWAFYSHLKHFTPFTPLEYLRGPFRGPLKACLEALQRHLLSWKRSSEVLFWSLLEVFWGSKKYNGGLYFSDLHEDSMGPPWGLHVSSMGTPKDDINCTLWKTYVFLTCSHYKYQNTDTVNINTYNRHCKYWI